MNRYLILFVFALNFYLPLKAGEGLWIPMLIDSLNYTDMKEMGLRLNADEIYSMNQASLKDVVVIFGSGCTGGLISPDGLIITNHHCGFSRIQSHSTVDNNYLTNGFWAESRDKELQNPGLTVSFLVNMENVTQKALLGISDTLSERERNRLIMGNISKIRQEAVDGTHYTAEVKPFFFGREYYLFIYEIFRDIRLVGAPSEAIGRFGGDTDNWIWPRHSGDFSLFRIYADKDNKPAEYSADNVPYKPRKYLTISVDGVKEGDFTMVIGYPGRTDEYLTSRGLEMIAKKSLPAKIAMRTLRLNALSEMSKGPESRLRFAAKYAGASNAWKKWIGITKGVERVDALETKKRQEEYFNTWALNLSGNTGTCSPLILQFEELYAKYEPFYLANDLGNELLNSVDLFSFADNTQFALNGSLDSSDVYKKKVTRQLKQSGSNFFRSGALAINRQILPEFLRIYAENTASQFHPAVFKQITSDYNGNYKAYTDFLFNTSVFTDSARYIKLLSKPAAVIRKKMSADPLTGLYRDMSIMLLYDVYGKADSLGLELNRLYRNYLSGLMKMDPSRIFYPDANFTMRVTYGRIEGYKPSDAVAFRYYSTLDGIMEKEDAEIKDFKVPAELKKLYNNQDFGHYTVEGRLPVCFIASNHTSGGNSGSPVLNADGDLIGINFDRNWEGTVSDYAYDPAVCRNISLDVRYVLFVIDKVADADWLLNELTIVDR